MTIKSRLCTSSNGSFKRSDEANTIGHILEMVMILFQSLQLLLRIRNERKISSRFPTYYCSSPRRRALIYYDFFICFSLCTSRSTARLPSVSYYVLTRTHLLSSSYLRQIHPSRLNSSLLLSFYYYYSSPRSGRSSPPTNSSSTYTVSTQSISRAPLSSLSQNPSNPSSKRTRTLCFSSSSYLSPLSPWRTSRTR